MDVIIQAPGFLQLQLPQEEWLNRYDAFAVARSRSGEGGPYVALTAADWQPARLRAFSRNSYDVLGKTLGLRLDGRIAVNVTFTGTSLAEVTSLLALAMPGYMSVTPLPLGGFLVGTTNVGLGASIEAVSGDAAPLLGFAVGDVQYGCDAWHQLVFGVTSYMFRDPYGLPTDYYQVRLLSTATPSGAGLVYPSFPGAPRNHLPIAQLIDACIELHDATGKAVVGTQVSLYASQRCQPGDIYSTAVTFRTDARGRGSCHLVRGLQMTLSIAGTNLAREILVPTEGDAFDLLDPAVSVDSDAYKVQVPDLVIGERRTL